MNRIRMMLLALAGTVLMVSSTSAAEGDRELLKRVSAALKAQRRAGKVAALPLTVSVQDARVVVTGKLASSDEARVVMDTVGSIEGIKGLDLNIGIGQEPAQRAQSMAWPPIYHASQLNRPLKWDDGHWNLDFGGQPPYPVPISYGNVAVAKPTELPEAGDPDLVGVYRVKQAEGTNATPDWRGFAAITRSTGIISNESGTSPLVFRFVTSRQGNRQLIDVTVNGDTDQTTLYGIYEVSGNTVKMSVANERIHTGNGRPQSYEAADPKKYSKFVLERISLESK